MDYVLDDDDETAERDGSISSYGDRPNEFEEVSEYFRAHFIQVHRRKDVSHRPLYLVRPPVVSVITVVSVAFAVAVAAAADFRAPSHSHRARLTLSFSFHFFPGLDSQITTFYLLTPFACIIPEARRCDTC